MNFEELAWRRHDSPKCPAMKNNSESVTTAYLGIDPTADSLHIGQTLVGVMISATSSAQATSP